MKVTNKIKSNQPEVILVQMTKDIKKCRHSKYGRYDEDPDWCDRCDRGFEGE